MTTWTTCRNDPDLVALWKAASAFAADVDSTPGVPPRWLTLCGASGCGKTHLARELYNWFRRYKAHFIHPTLGINQLHDCRFVDTSELAGDLKKGLYAHAAEIARCHFLVLDDLGAERDTSGFLAEQFLKLLNQRMGKWTIITSNLTLSQISDQLDARIADRMRRGNSIVLESKSPSFADREQLPQDESQSIAPVVPAFGSAQHPAKVNP